MKSITKPMLKQKRIMLLALLSLILVLSGCHRTVFLAQNKGQLKPFTNQQEALNVSVLIKCRPKTYTFMISPFLPLPPIIPKITRPEKTLITVHSDHRVVTQVFLKDRENFKLTKIRTKHERSDYSGEYTTTAYCSDLRSNPLIIEYSDIKERETRSIEYRLMKFKHGFKIKWDMIAESKK